MFVYQGLVEEALLELADESEQRQLWLSSESPACFIECVCQLFDDSGLGDALAAGTVYGDDVDSRLRELGRLAACIDEYRHTEDLLTDPTLQVVRALATESLDAIQAGREEAR